MVPLPRLFYLSLFSFPMPVGRVSRQQAVAFERLGHHLSGRVDRRNKYTFFFEKARNKYTYFISIKNLLSAYRSERPFLGK